MGLNGLSLDKLQGWDLSDKKVQDWVYTELGKYPPELLMLCPPCADAGGWFHYNSCFMSMQEYLRRVKQLRSFVRFCERLIEQQLRLGGRFLFEHPVCSRIWKENPSFRKWCNDLHSCVIDMCCYNLHLPETSKESKKLIKKSTRLLMSHADMRDVLERRCPGHSGPEHVTHAVIAGSHASVGPVSKHAGRYTPEFVQAIIRSVPALRSHEVLVVQDELMELQHIQEVLAAQDVAVDDADLLRVLKILHANLGHPSNQELVRVLKHGQASDRALTLAAKLECPMCEAHKGPAIANPAQVKHASFFNEKIGIDVKHLTGWTVNQKVKALNVVDYASNFQMMIPFFERETATVLRQLLSDRWLAWAGPPQEIVMDPAKTNLGKALTEPCELEGTHISPTAAGAHWQLGKVEVHGGLFNRVLEKVVAERNPRTKEQWLDCVRHCHVKNATIQTHRPHGPGYTPSQVVFGRNPTLPGELLDEPRNVISSTAALLEQSVEETQALRHAAKKAILGLQDAKHMRRALAARPRLARNFRPGDIVAYWRDQKWSQGILSRGGRWYGSGVVLGNIGRNVVIAHRNQILRCAPEQVRPNRFRTSVGANP